MNKTIKFLINKNDVYKRVDIYLSEKINSLTRSYIKKLIEKGNLIINGKKILSPSTKIKEKDEILINVIKSEENKLIPKNININIVFEDKDIIVIDKPKGMVVHPGAGNREYTLANALAFKFKNQLSDMSGKLRPGIVHRIDKETSGLLVIAKNNFAHSNLSKQFSEHTIKRKYQCLAWGVIRPLSGKIVTLITRSKKNRQLMSVSEIKGKKAITNYKTVKVFQKRNIPKISLVECTLETGRTHQIRVHLQHKGSSILGDQHYGKKNLRFKKLDKIFFENLSKIKGQALHAQTLEFNHPKHNKWLKFKSSLPEDFAKMLNFLNKRDS